MARNHRQRIAPRGSTFRLLIRRSPIQGLGVFAAERIPPRRKVMEYTGALFSRPRLEKRVRQILKRHGRMPRCVFRLSRYWYVDGGIRGCGAERINHSCDPNLKPRIIRGHILLFSRRAISVGEELTYDYYYRRQAPRTICRCHSPKCRGTINRK
jgi:SET domain-containing protein